MVTVLATIGVVFFSVVFFISMFVLSSFDHDLERLRSSTLQLSMEDVDGLKEYTKSCPACDISECGSLDCIGRALSEQISALNTRIEEKRSQIYKSKTKMREAKSQLACMTIEDTLVHQRYTQIMEQLRRDIGQTEQDCRELQEQFADATASRHSFEMGPLCVKEHASIRVIKPAKKASKTDHRCCTCDSDKMCVTHSVSSRWTAKVPAGRPPARPAVRSQKTPLKHPRLANAPCSSKNRRQDGLPR